MKDFLNKLKGKSHPEEAKVERLAAADEPITRPVPPPVSANSAMEKTDTVPSPTTQVSSEASTAPLTEDQLKEITDPGQKVEPQQYRVGASHNVGRQRETNEDSVYIQTGLISTNNGSLPFGIFIIADGMGGHHNGEVASEQAVRSMGTHLNSKMHDPLFGPEPHNPDESLQEIVSTGVQKAHQDIVKRAIGGGTTMTAVLSIGTQMTIGHVGDSRAYAIYLDGRMQTLTRDHSLVKRLQELGQITEEEAAVHPQKSMLYRALGQGDAPEPDIFTAAMPDPGYLMVCSDGLWGVISEEEIFECITSAANIKQACQNLVDAANAAGGPDNISVILVRLTN